MPAKSLILLKSAAAPAVPKLTALLNHEDLWLRIKAAEALSHIGLRPCHPCRSCWNASPRTHEIRSTRHGATLPVFFHLRPMLANSLDGVDRDLLRKAVVAGLRNEDGRARSSITGIYKMLSFEEIEPLLPAILDAVAKPAPSGEMFADGFASLGWKFSPHTASRKASPPA